MALRFRRFSSPNLRNKARPRSLGHTSQASDCELFTSFKRDRNTANLGILPNENFQSSGQGHNNSTLSVGVTYYGRNNNNAYNEPPFGVVNANLSSRSTNIARCFSR
jgi:hypothetical protein